MATLAAQRNLPKLPMMSFGEEMVRSNYKKAQVLAQRDQGAPMYTEPDPLRHYDTVDIPDAKDTTFWSTTATSVGKEVWDALGFDPNRGKPVSLDRKVLRFRAYFREPVFDSAAEQHRVRIVYIYYHLEDDTISVAEPKQDNSGIPGQGNFVKRHTIPKPNGDEVYTYDDFNIGNDVTFYCRTFRLIDCDAFTRRFLEQLGKVVPPGTNPPADQYTATRKAQSDAMGARKQKKGDDMDYLGGNMQRTAMSAREISKTKQFLAYDKQVLRFNCLWDDRDAPHGDLRYFNLYYFLSDDTIEITEVETPNCGRDPFPSFVKRSKVPKPVGGKYESPNASLLFKSELTQYYTEADLRIGETLQIFGRYFIIYDCDAFTKEYLGKVFGITDFTPLNVAQSLPPRVTEAPPPHNGFGDEEDALKSWKYLLPSARLSRKDAQKRMDNADKQLKFQLRFHNGDPANEVRRFVLTFFLADDTLSIFEPPQRNSGIVGGKFLQRQKVKRVRLDGIPTGDYIASADLFVGAVVIINTHKFQIYGTDERTLQWMESNPDQFPRSNVNKILTRMRQLVGRDSAEAFRSADADGSGKLDFREFAAVLEGLHLPLSEHELLTVMRYFDCNGDGAISYIELCQVLGL